MASKIDLYGQILLLVTIIVSAMLFPIWPIGIFISLICIIPLGLWQLISAAILWVRHKGNFEKAKPINRYWLFAIICLSGCVISVVSASIGESINNGIYKYLFIASMCGSLFVSMYYIFIYRKYYLHNESKENSSAGRIVEPEAL